MTIQEKRLDALCEMHNAPRDEVYAVTIPGDQGEAVLCWACLKKQLDFRLRKTGKVKPAPKAPSGSQP